mgnify:CR=1 FL=1
MAIINNAADGFPVDKVREAVSYISALKPHWGPMSSGTSIVPSSTDTLPGEQFAAITSTDKDGNIYVDRAFALSSSVPEIAAAIEFQYQLHLRKMWDRMSWVPEDQWHDVAPMAMSLEINSAMESEYKRISLTGEVSESFLMKAGLTAAEIRKYQLGKMPDIRSIGGFFPDELGLEHGMTAEKYAEVILDAMQSQDIIDPESEDSTNDEAEGEETPQEIPQEEQETPQDGQNSEAEDSDSGENDMAPDSAPDDSGSDEPQESSGESQEDSDGGDGQECQSDDNGESDASEEDGEGQDGDDSSDQEESQELDDAADQDNSDDQEDSDGQGGSGEDSDGRYNGADSQDGDNSVDGDSNSSDGEDQVESGSEGQSGDPGDGESDTSEGSGEGDTTDSEPGESSQPTMQNGTPLDQAKEVMDKIDERMDDPSSSMWQNSIHNPDDALDTNPMKPDSMQFDDAVGDESRLEDALDEVYEDLVASSKDPGVFSGDVDNASLAVAVSHMKKKKADFASRQRRVTVSAVQSARMAGATDMSLAVRSANQPMLGPIMPGTFDYSPRIYCIQDVSGSMRGAYTIAAGKVFQDVTSDVASSFNAKTLWIAVDFAVRAVSETSRWEDSKIWGTNYYGGGITDISEIAVSVSLGKLIFEGRRYPEPDVLCILTDGKFKWPDRRPRVKTKWIITTFKSCVQYLPDWLHKDEIVTID